MEWITAVRKSVKFIEEHLKDKISAQGAAVKTFLPLGIKIDVSGGDKMDVKIKNLFGFFSGPLIF